MSNGYNTNVVANEQIAEYGKFIKLDNQTRFPAISVIRTYYPDKSEAFPGNTNAIPITSIDIYPKFGVITYIANTDEFAVTLSAEQVNLDTSLIEAHLSNIDPQTYTTMVASTAIELNTFDAASGINELNYNFLNAVSALSTTIVNPIVIGEKGSNNTATIYEPTSSLNVNVTNTTINSITTPTPTQLDAFGRLRVSNAFTLFDSSHRYGDNNLWATLTAVGGTYSFNQNQGLIDMTVSSLSGSSVIRETTKVFSYQPGKSLLVMNTFAMAPSANNLRQRVGYFGADNGIYIQLDDGVLSFVERSIVNQTPPTETIVPASAWNGDRLDGTGPSGLTLDITKAQIFWMDIEWLGLGSVRVGFIIDGKYILCHTFYHANKIASTYITTASLPLRYEITNKGATSGPNTLKQVCSTVISEGGYELRGLQQAVSLPITSPRTFAATNTFYPLISIRLKAVPDRLDAIVVITAISLLSQGNGINYQWRLVASGTTSGGSWTDPGTVSSVEYNSTATSITGGRVLASGYLNSSNQGSPNLDILREALFKFQLERDGLTKTPYEITLAAAADTTQNAGMFAALDWEEISR